MDAIYRVDGGRVLIIRTPPVPDMFFWTAAMVPAFTFLSPFELTARFFSAIPLARQCCRDAAVANPPLGNLCAMFSNLLRNVKKQRELHSWRRSPLGRSINEHIRSYNKTWAALKKEEKEQLASEFYARIFAVLDSPDAFSKCRKELVTNVTAYTDLEVLCLTAQDKEKSPIFKDMTRISSDLRDHIYKCTLRNEELNKYIEENTYNESELIDFANKRRKIYHYYACGFDIVRKSIEGVKEKDWFVALLQSSMIISELNYRKYLGLPAVVTAIDSSFHYSFIDMILNGEQDPLSTWERRFGKSYSDTI